MFSRFKPYLFCWLLLFTANAHSAINVFACEPEWAALARALGGDKVTVFSATTAQQDPHYIQARPSLIAKARRADLLICTGAELEAGWLPLLLRKSANGKILPGQAGHFMAAEHVRLMEKPAILDRSEGDIHASGNPHIHLDPRRIAVIAQVLVETLINIDSDNLSSYQANGQTFKQQWSQAMEQWSQQTQALRGKKIVVNHNSWVYLQDWVGLERLATLEPKPGIAPSTSHLAKVLAKMNNNPADMILYANYQNDKAVRWLAQKTNIPATALPFSVSDKESLIQWYDRLIQRLVAVQ